MSKPGSPFHPVSASLADIAGEAYAAAVCEARAAVTGEDLQHLMAVSHAPVDFLPARQIERTREMLPRVGERICTGLAESAPGATSRAFAAATHTGPAPLTGFGVFRVGEDGTLYLTTKSEHYHTPLGHAFPGYAVLQQARAIGIANATHNNTRGHITRLLEAAIVQAAGGPGSKLDRVLNTETGSLAVEAGIKMMLARFYRSQDDMPAPAYEGRIPVFLLPGNVEGGLAANYHGTTVLAQMMRGMWPGLAARLDEAGALRAVAFRPNNIEDVQAAFARWEQPPFKIAGVLHEIVMMNYGGRVLTPGFLRHLHAACAAHDVPTLVDEIQSCVWAPGMFLFREWGLQPDFVAVGKGFPGGEYPASRILFGKGMDNLAQFGALVTNGQEEIASLAYLVTMRWALANADVTRAIGDRYAERLHGLASAFPDRIAGITGTRHMSAICFHDLTDARRFALAMNQRGLDISVQAYKSDCPPAVLTKIPLIADDAVADFVVDRLRAGLEATAA